VLGADEHGLAKTGTTQAERKAQDDAVGVRNVGSMAATRVKDRKRHILVDTLGKLINLLVTAANLREGKAAIEWLKPTPKLLFKKRKHIWAYGGYRGEFVDWGRRKVHRHVSAQLESDDVIFPYWSYRGGHMSALWPKRKKRFFIPYSYYPPEGENENGCCYD
jgi:hypothetical protein